MSLDEDSRAHLEVISRVTLFLRNLSWPANSLEFCKLNGDLMDAIHNTPNQIINPFCSIFEYVQLYYQSFDEKYPNSISLVKIFNEAKALNAK